MEVVAQIIMDTRQAKGEIDNYRVINLNWQKVLSLNSYMHHLTNLESFAS